MTNRKRPSRSVEKDVLVASRRRCCLCVHLNDQSQVRKGQIAHLNRNPHDSRFENLVYLCLEHHDEYDSRSSQSKAYSIEEVREYRRRLYNQYQGYGSLAEHAVKSESSELAPLLDYPPYEDLERRFAEDLAFMSRPWSFPLWQVADEPELFAYKAPNGMDGVCLIERIDLPDGRIVVACIAVAGSPGNSITNCVEYLCFQVCARFDIPADRLVWIEHYDYYSPAEWKLVTFATRPPDFLFTDPVWTEMTTEDWKGLRLRPKKKMKSLYGSFESKITKLFPWPLD